MKFFSFILSIAAIGIASMSLWGESSQITSDSLIAVISICTTIVVGVHLYDAWTLHKMEAQLEELKGLEKQIEDMKQKLNIAFHISWGLSFISRNPGKAYMECWKAFEIAMRINDTIRANTCLKCLESISKDFKNVLQPDKITLSEELLSNPLYKIFKDRIDKL